MNFKNLLTKLNPFKAKGVEPSALITPLPLEDKDVAEIDSQEKEQTKEQAVKQKLPSEKTWKCSEQEKQLMVSWHAMGFTPSEIVEKAKDEMNISISSIQVHQYTKAEKWQALIKKVREETMQDLASVAGSHKKVRLQRHEKVYDKAISKNKFDLAIKATEAQRKEMEEGNISLTLNQFNILSDEELKHKHEEVLTRIKNLSNKGVIDVPTNKTEAVRT